MAGRYSSLQIKGHFKEWTAASGSLKKICFYKNWMLQIDPLNKSFSQKLEYPEKKIKAINPSKKQLFGEISCSKFTLASANV